MDRLRVYRAPWLVRPFMALLFIEAIYKEHAVFTREHPSQALIQKVHIRHGQIMRHGHLGHFMRRVWYRLRYRADRNPFIREITQGMEKVMVRRR